MAAPELAAIPFKAITGSLFGRTIEKLVDLQGFYEQFEQIGAIVKIAMAKINR